MTKSIKIMHEQLDLADGSPIKIKWCDYDYFRFPWHFHNEYEIVYVIHGSGTRFAGSSIEPFTDGDLVLFGSFFPHMFKSDEAYYKGDPNLRVHAITIQFKKDFFNHAIAYYPEFKRIKNLLINSQNGVLFELEGNQIIRKRIRDLINMSGLNRLLECINILSLMSKTKHKRILGDQESEINIMKSNDERMVKVLSKLNRDYTQEISLEDVSDIAGMNPSAFCRYFKEKTGKSMIRYINELRITFACKLLLEGRLTISQICYECGFNNLSNFNKQFKIITKYTPSSYLSQFKKIAN